MAKYRKRPVIVEAVQYFLGKTVPGLIEEDAVGRDGEPIGKIGFVTTIHGYRTSVASGDWVITESDGIHHYPCKPEVFATNYEPVE